MANCHAEPPGEVFPRSWTEEIDTGSRITSPRESLPSNEEFGMEFQRMGCIEQNFGS
jgi:hypothetical protein